jgi:hypothetical protein
MKPPFHYPEDVVGQYSIQLPHGHIALLYQPKSTLNGAKAYWKIITGGFDLEVSGLISGWLEWDKFNNIIAGSVIAIERIFGGMLVKAEGWKAFAGVV